MTPGKQLILKPAVFNAELDFTVINENVFPHLLKSQEQLLKAFLFPAPSHHQSMGLKMVPCLGKCPSLTSK